MTTEEFIEKMNVIINEYKPESIMILFGKQKESGLFDESAMVHGDMEYMKELFETCKQKDIRIAIVTGGAKKAD